MINTYRHVNLEAMFAPQRLAPSFTMKFEQTEEGQDCGAIRVSVSRCSPKDHFSRKKGRLITDGRMKAGKSVEFIFREGIPLVAQGRDALFDKGSKDYEAIQMYGEFKAFEANFMKELDGE